MSDRQLQNIQDTIKLPIYQEENSRRGYDKSSQFDQFFQNLVPEFIVDQTTQTKTQRLSKRQGIAITGLNFMTGITASTNCTILDVIPISAVYDVFVLSLFDASNNTIYIIQIRPQAATATLIGSFTSTPACTANDYCFLTEISQASGGNLLPALAVSYTNSIQTVGKGFYAITSSGVFTLNSLTTITDVNFPANQTPALITIGRFVNMNGSNYIASLDGRIWNSGGAAFPGNDISTWTTSTGQIGSISVNSYPDQCIGLERYKHHIIAFGRNSMEFFNDVGNIPSPLARTDQAFIKFGCKSPRMIKNANDTLYWFSYGDIDSTGLWMLDGYTPTKISTPYIDTSAISTWGTDVDHAYQNLQAVMINQKPHILISGIITVGYLNGSSSFPLGTGPVNDTFRILPSDTSQNNVCCYNVQDRTWWSFSSQSILNPYPIFATEFTGLSSAGNYSQIVLYNGSGGQFASRFVYKLRTDGVYSDGNDGSADSPITTIAQLNQQWFGNEKRKRISKLKVIMDYPVQSGTDTNVYSMWINYIRDNVQLYNPVLVGGIARGFNIPNPQYRHYINNLGMGRAWSFILLEKSELNIVYKELELDIQQGSN